ncbi:MAG: type II toxin-antitoxin system RelE/ParE family toxin [Flexilinea sp.]|nr:type II toxin-antitoxin system RelE/ParE family toxin [Flexilinea sp.]
MAQEQVFQIAQYILRKFQDPEAANQIVDRLESAILSLDKMPERVPLADIEPWRSKGLHKFIVGHYIVYFIIMESELRVRVTAVVLGRMDQKIQLDQMEL